MIQKIIFSFLLKMAETTIESVPTIVASSNILGLDIAASNTVSKNLPFVPKQFSHLKSNDFQKDLVNFIKKYPEIDFVYRFELPKYDFTDKESWCMQAQECFNNLPFDTGKGVFVGGSTALHYAQSYIKGHSTLNWKANDSDLFFLNCVKNTRMELGSLDFVFCKDKTIEEVLLNFDLPCCRVGFDFKYNFYVSAQALVSIFTGKMYMPEYFSNENDFADKLNQFNHLSGDKNLSLSSIKSINQMIIQRFYQRIKKYKSRGFNVVYTHLDYMLPWVKNRFTYIDFSEMKN